MAIISKMYRAASKIYIVAFLLLLAPAGSVYAQLASSFYNVTDISYKVLPNAVKITVQADGLVNYGIEGANVGTTSQIKIRMLGARTSMPSYVNIGAYPVDSANIYPAQDSLINPININNDWAGNPKVDIVIRFYIPVNVIKYRTNDYERESTPVLTQRQVSIERGSDRRSIVITVITDRTDFKGAANIKRSPPEQQNHHLNIEPVETDSNKRCTDAVLKNGPYYKVDALHTPLRELAQTVSKINPDYPLNVSEDASDIDISMHLPLANLESIVNILEHGYALNALEDKEHGGIVIGRSIAPVSTSIPLQYLRPESARLMFPDFLLPSLHIDTEHNSLVVSGTPLIVDKINKDISFLDIPAPSILIEARVYELTSESDTSLVIKASRTIVRDSENIDTLLGNTSLIIQKDQTNRISTTLNALITQGHVRLVAKPSLKVISEMSGNIFLGQQKYVTVLQNNWQGQSVNAIPVSVGTKLNIWARATGNDILIYINPKITTVDSIEQDTGLPTIGIRECSTSLHIRSGDTIIVSGLESINDNATHRRNSPLNRLPLIGGLFRSMSKGYSRKSVILLLNAKVLS